jgi:hypothetical protein
MTAHRKSSFGLPRPFVFLAAAVLGMLALTGCASEAEQQQDEYLQAAREDFDPGMLSYTGLPEPSDQYLLSRGRAYCEVLVSYYADPTLANSDPVDYVRAEVPDDSRYPSAVAIGLLLKANQYLCPSADS